MQIAQYLKVEGVCANLQVADKDEALRVISYKLAELLPGLDRDGLHQRILDREQQSSTGVGGSVAIPHSADDSIQDPVCVLAQIPKGIEFDAPDGKPVQLVFMVLFPEGSTGIQLKLLARIARLCSYEDLVGRLQKAANAQELYDLLCEEDRRHV